MKIDDNGIVRDMTKEEAEYQNSVPAELPQPTDLDRIEAQVMFTALMTDTLLEE